AIARRRPGGERRGRGNRSRAGLESERALAWNLRDATTRIEANGELAEIVADCDGSSCDGVALIEHASGSGAVARRRRSGRPEAAAAVVQQDIGDLPRHRLADDDVERAVVIDVADADGQRGVRGLEGDRSRLETRHRELNLVPVAAAIGADSIGN